MKRLFDLFASLAVLVLLSPLLLAIAVLVRIKLGSPVLFAQDRPGLHGRVFTLWKFRSMTDARDKGESCCRMRQGSTHWEGCCARRASTSCPNSGTS